MNILNEKKEVTPIITPSLGYKLRSINWNEDFYFDNPIDKEKINSIPKAIEISKIYFLLLRRVECSIEKLINGMNIYTSK